jgi:hypothetical protein
MALFRYVFYFLGIGLFTWLLTMLEISSPGSLKFHVFVGPGDTLGTSEYSPIEMIQPGILGLLYAWVAKNCVSQRPIAFLFGGVALAFIIRELDYFLDRYVARKFLATVDGGRRRTGDRLYLAPSAPFSHRLAALVAVAWPYAVVCGRHHHVRFRSTDRQRAVVDGDTRRRLSAHRQTGRGRIYRATRLLLGYYLWLIGTIEYTYQAWAITLREPQPAAARRRAARFPKSEGRF